MFSWQGVLPSASEEQGSNVRRDISHTLRVKSFHKVSVGRMHACSLSSCIGKARIILTSLSPAGAARRLHGESTRNHSISRRVAHCSGGDDQPTWPSPSDAELVPVRRPGVDAYYPQGSAEISQPATGSSHRRVHLRSTRRLELCCDLRDSDLH